MITSRKKDFRRFRIKKRVRKVVEGTPDRPRMTVFRSSKS
ncbi:MAG: 50S ribosomal protein L18, partial [Bacteroidota bacterium]